MKGHVPYELHKVSVRDVMGVQREGGRGAPAELLILWFSCNKQK